jgi:hypothetical protein
MRLDTGRLAVSRVTGVETHVDYFAHRIHGPRHAGA